MSKDKATYLEMLSAQRLRLQLVEQRIAASNESIALFREKKLPSLVRSQELVLKRYQNVRDEVASMVAELEQLTGALPLRGGK